MSIDRRIKSLKTRQKSLLTSFGLIKSFVDEYTEAEGVREVGVRLEHLRESASDLHSLVEKFEANVKVLQQLGERTEYWDILLIRMLSSRLDPTTRRDWEEHSSTLNVISFSALTTFIQRRVTVLQSIGKANDGPSLPIANKKPTQRAAANYGANTMSQRKCIACSDRHPLYQCVVFSKLSVDEKEREVRKYQLCRNCLRKGHLAKECPSSSTCRKCKGHHHTQLCQSSGLPASKSNEVSEFKENPLHQSVEQPSASVSASLDEHSSYATAGRRRKSVLLATAIVIIVDDHGREHTARALLDSGSGKRSSFQHSRCLRLDDPPGIQLADPAFHQPNHVDLILGAEIFFELFNVTGRIQLGNGLPTLVNSVFGWVVSGETTQRSITTPIVCNIATVSDINNLMEKFWSIEEDSVRSCYSVEEIACEEHFRRTFSRNPDGRYIVRLPVKEEVIVNLVDNRRTAIRRFRLLQTQLARNEELNQQYCDFMNEYLTSGHMQRVEENQSSPRPCYYLPHHAVVKEDSTTTRVRVVLTRLVPHQMAHL
ncbi:uncharacterized protein LOC134209443 [Armigeres subalbatus]|uniref:uncharacterized protein LOC134209443 n=1 Tax=Armigeres subalbatus TaxID=124917 RepID=UPI002ED5BD56